MSYDPTHDSVMSPRRRRHERPARSSVVETSIPYFAVDFSTSLRSAFAYCSCATSLRYFACGSCAAARRRNDSNPRSSLFTHFSTSPMARAALRRGGMRRMSNPLPYRAKARHEERSDEVPPPSGGGGFAPFSAKIIPPRRMPRGGTQSTLSFFPIRGSRRRCSRPHSSRRRCGA